MSKEAAMALATGTPVASPPVSAVEGTGSDATQPADQVLGSDRFAHLAKKEAQIVREREEIKRERALVLKDRENMTEAIAKITEFQALKDKDKIAAIKSLGFDDTDIINYFAEVSSKKEDPVELARKAAEEVTSKFEREQKERADGERKQREDATLTKFRLDINQHIASDKDNYEFCNYYGKIAEDLIYDTVSEALMLDLKTNPNAEPMSLKEAIDLVEKYYEDQDKALGKLKKRSKSAEPAVAPPEAAPARAPSAPTHPPRTLTSRVAQTVASTVNRVETKEQKRERLIQQLGSMGK